MEGSTGAAEIKANLQDQEEEVVVTMPLKEHPSICLKGDNQGSIALTYNPVYHAQTKHIDIQHYYICDEVAARRINLQYIPTSEIIADGLTKALIHAKFHIFLKQMNMN